MTGALSDDLSRATDRLNDAFRKVEDAFGRVYTGVCASVSLSDRRGALSFSKRGNVWGLYVMWNDGTCCHLTTASRLVRVDAATMIRRLGEQLRGGFIEQTAEVAALASDLERYAVELVKE